MHSTNSFGNATICVKKNLQLRSYLKIFTVMIVIGSINKAKLVQINENWK